MENYVALPGNPSGSEPPRIACVDGAGNYVTVLSRTFHEAGFPVDTMPLLQNVAALLNGRAPLHTLSSPQHQINYQRLPGGVALHFRDPAGGVGRVGFMLTVPQHDISRELGQAALGRMDAEFMRTLHDTIRMGAASLAAAPGVPGARPTQP